VLTTAASLIIINLENKRKPFLKYID